jgi:hypothetical protein
MSTRAQIGFYSDNFTPLEKYSALIYRHSDGYPGTADGKKYGVIHELRQIVRGFKKARRFWDTHYLAARTLQQMCNIHDGETWKIGIPAKQKSEMNCIGYEICGNHSLHGDIAWFYAVKPDFIEIYAKVEWDKDRPDFQDLEFVKRIKL